MKVFKALLIGLRNFLKRPKRRVLYAVTGGQFLGEFFVYMEKKKDNFTFLSLPHMKIRDIPEDKYYFAIDNTILDKAGKVPRSVYSVCKKQYIKNKSGLNN